MKTRAPHGTKDSGARTSRAPRVARKAAPATTAANDEAMRAILGNGIQRKVAVTAPGDNYEREADRVAEHVVADRPAPLISRLSGGGPQRAGKGQAEDEKKKGQRKEKKPEDEKKSQRKEKKPEDEKKAQRKEKKPEDEKKAQRKEKKPDDEKKAQRKEKKPDDEKKAQRKEKSPDDEQKAQRKEKKPEDEKKAQRKEKKPEDEKKTQRKEKTPDDEQKAQRKEKKPEDEQKAQRKEKNAEDDRKLQRRVAQADRAPDEAPALPHPDTLDTRAQEAIDQKGPGQPLDAGTRGKLERSMGVDLGNVRVHEDAQAREAAQDLNARAFTHGNDIWLGPGESQQDTRLMAHEATHVVQQQSGLLQRVVQRDTPPAAAPAGNAGPGGAAPGGGATVDHQAKTITIPTLQVPSYNRKSSAIPQPLPLPKAPERPSDQREVWSNGIQQQGGYKDAVLKGIDKDRGITSARTGKLIQVLKPNSSDTYIIGERDSLPAKLTLPRWDKNGKGSSYDVDHKREMQLGGSNTIDNMELLDSSANRSSGSRIHNEIQSKLTEAITPEVGEGKHWSKMPDLKKVQGEYQVTFTTTTPSIEVAGSPENFWSVDNMKTGEHVKTLKTLSAQEITSKHLVGDKTHLLVYPRATGGSAKKIGWNPDSNTPEQFNGNGIFKNFEATGVTYTPGAGGAITGTKKFGKDLMESKQVTWKLNEMEGLDYTTCVDRRSVLESLAAATVPGASPVTISEVDLDDSGGVGARGILSPTLPLLKGLELDIALSSDELTLSKTFNGGELSFPGPVQVTGSTLTLAAGTDGLSVTGDVNFDVKRLGKGKISGMGAFGGKTDAGFAIKGDFELDKKVFDGEARIEAGYEKEEFWAKGHLSIGEGKIKGIKTASIDAAFVHNAFSATGTVETNLPAVEKASLGIDYSEESGLKFAGDLQIKKDTPGISGGSIHVETLQAPGSDQFKTKGSGSATPNIPGIDSQLAVDYNDGAFTATFSGTFHRGMLTGNVTAGVTNRTLDASGAPTGEPSPDSPLIVYGSGSATLKLAPWLQGTAGIRFQPDGEVIVQGEIGLPSQFEIFPRKQLDKSLFNVAVQAPIFPGIVAEIGGGLSAQAGIGPGVIDQLRLGITYNPAHEDQTHVTGDAHLKVPADAGLRLAVRAGIGLGITGASATGGLEIGGMAGITGAAEAGVHIDWTPGTGLQIDANADLHAEPRFKFDISGYVAVTALGLSVYDHRWQLGAYEFGSNLQLGVKFPIHYEEGQPFNLSLSDVEFTVPDVNVNDLLSGLIGQIA